MTPEDGQLDAAFQEMNRWFAEAPHPAVPEDCVRRVKAAVVSVACSRLSEAATPMFSDEARARIKSAVRTRVLAAPAARFQRLLARPARAYPWLMAAASVVLLVGGLQWLSERETASPVEVVWVPGAAPELLDIELDMLAIEGQAAARELALFGSFEGGTAEDLQELSDPDYLIDLGAWLPQEGAS